MPGSWVEVRLAEMRKVLGEAPVGLDQQEFP